MSDLPNCPECASEFTYEDRNLLVCPQCGHEWSKATAEEDTQVGPVIKDANGNELKNGDAVTVIKDLKVKGSSTVVKVGTKVKISVWSMATTASTVKSPASVPCS